MKKILLSSLGVLSIAVASAQNTHNFTYGWAAPDPQVYVVPACVGKLEITARGASGCDQNSQFSAGKGAHVQGSFDVNPGDTLLIRVGQNPCTGFSNVSYNGGTGGGGGTYVVKKKNGVYTPLAIAGGGGGGGNVENNMKHGQASTTAGAGVGGSWGGAGSSGGGGGTSGFSGSGGGYLTDGGTGSGANMGGKSFMNGSAGGTTNYHRGGFGGGGAGIGSYSGGGGGGYNGGGGAGSDGCGGGGSSYNAGYATNDSTGVNTGHGKVTIKEFVKAPNFNSTYTTQDVKCKGDANGVVQITATGDNTPLKYIISGANSTNPTYPLLDGGNHWYVIKDACNNVSDTTFFTIYEPQTAFAGSVITVPGGDDDSGVIEINATGGDAPYTFELNGVNNGTNNKWENLANGSYLATATDANGCVLYFEITLWGYASNNELNLSQLSVFPNPATNILNISNDKAVTFALLDLTGKTIAESKSFALTHTLFTENLASGIYLLKVRTENNTVKSVKVVIK